MILCTNLVQPFVDLAEQIEVVLWETLERGLPEDARRLRSKFPRTAIGAAARVIRTGVAQA